MIKEGQEVFVKVGDDYVTATVEEIAKEGNKKYYGVSGFTDWKTSKEIFENKPKVKGE